MIDGVDVSTFQATTPPLAGLAFLIARATYGTSRDSRAAMHVDHARRAGLVTGLYHFGRTGNIPGQLAAFRAAIAEAGPVDLIALDLERDGSNPSMTDLEAREFVAELPGCGLYASTSRYVDVGQAWRWVADYRAAYASSGPPIPWDVWQWTSSAGGVSLDRDRFRGTAAQLRGLGMTQSPITDTTPALITVAAGSALYDLDGKTVIRSSSAALDWRPSPYGVGALRALYISGTAGANRRVALVKPAAIRSVVDAVKAERDRIVTAGKAALDTL